jgi:hypothetical protein
MATVLPPQMIMAFATNKLKVIFKEKRVKLKQ